MKLDLGYNQIGDIGVKYISDMLKINSTINVTLFSR